MPPAPPHVRLASRDEPLSVKLRKVIVPFRVEAAFEEDFCFYLRGIVAQHGQDSFNECRFPFDPVP